MYTHAHTYTHACTHACLCDSRRLFVCVPACLPTCLPTCLPAYLPSYECLEIFPSGKLGLISLQNPNCPSNSVDNSLPHTPNPQPKTHKPCLNRLRWVRTSWPTSTMTRWDFRKIGSLVFGVQGLVFGDEKKIIITRTPQIRQFTGRNS